MNLKCSCRIYLQEKYYALFSELQHMYRIIDYYQNSSDKNKKSTLYYLKQNIESIIDIAKKKYEHPIYGVKKISTCEDKKNDSEVEIIFIISYDIQREYLEEILKYMGKVHQKIIQYLYESHINTLPHPFLLKRYSSKVLSEIIDNHAVKLGKIISNKDSFHIFSSWSYKETYEMRSFFENAYSSFGNHSFYYHDLACALPVIVDHEVILAAFGQNKGIQDSIEKSAKEIAKEFGDFIDEKERYDEENSISLVAYQLYESYRDVFADKGKISVFLEEYYSGYINYLLNGDSFLLAYLHETLSLGFGRLFEKKENYAKTLLFMPDEKRDFSLIRQILSLQFSEPTTLTFSQTYTANLKDYLNECRNLCEDIVAYDKDENDISNETSRIIEELRNIIYDKKDRYAIKAKYKELEEIIFVYDQGFMGRYFIDSFKQALGVSESIFDEVSENWFTFLEYRNMLKAFIQIVSEKTKLFSEQFTSLLQDLQEFTKGSPFFAEEKYYMKSINSKIWIERISCLEKSEIRHRSVLREELLEIGNEYKIEPYILSEKRFLHSKMNINQKEPIAFGHYDSLKFVKKEKSMCIESFSNNIEELMKTDNNNDDIFFEKKHALLKIEKCEHTKENRDENNEENMQVILQIYMNNSTDTKKSIDLIKSLFDDNTLKSYYLKMDIYKSLGPEDVICVFKIDDQKEAWAIVEKIEKYENVKDTFMTLQITSPYKLDECIWVKQLIRLNTPMSYKSFKQKVLDSNNLDSDYFGKELQIFEIEGIYDFEIWWKIENFEIIANSYNQLVTGGIIDETNSFFIYENCDT